MSNVIPFPTDYTPAPSSDDPDLATWTWWWNHVRSRISADYLRDLGMFPCRAGGKPAFLCNFDFDDREHMFAVRIALAAAIPEHASDVVFVRSGNPDAPAAIDFGIRALYAA